MQPVLKGRKMTGKNALCFIPSNAKNISDTNSLCSFLKVFFNNNEN